VKKGMCWCLSIIQ